MEKIAQDGGIVIYYNSQNVSYRLYIDITNDLPTVEGTLKECLIYLLDKYNFSVFAGIIAQIKTFDEKMQLLRDY